VRSGAFIGAAQVGLLAAVGQAKVLVHPRPRLSIISVGDELVDVARTPGPGQVYDVNSFALAAAARDAGADVTRVGIAPADIRRLQELVESRLLVSEALVLSGAAGGHAAELVVEALSGLGDLDLTRVAMQPGSAQGFGLLGPDRVPTFLLPANPVSALVVFEVIVRPVLRLMLGRRNPYRRTVTARTLSPIQSPPDRRQFLRGQLMRDEDDEYLVHILGGGGTHLLASLAEANCLVLVDESTSSIPSGGQVSVSFLAQRA
jgi:molybdopterin molybdotransferase